VIRGLATLSWDNGLNTLVAEGIEAIVFRTVGDQCALWESILPEQVRRLPEELARVDALLDDPSFFAPFVMFFDPRMGMSIWSRVRRAVRSRRRRPAWADRG
jgi:IS5 family transposase